MYYNINKTNKVFSTKNWFFELCDNKTSFKCIVEYKKRKLYFYDMEHPNIISGTAVFYKNQLRQADIIFKHYNNKFWFGEIIERAMPTIWDT